MNDWIACHSLYYFQFHQPAITRYYELLQGRLRDSICHTHQYRTGDPKHQLQIASKKDRLMIKYFKKHRGFWNSFVLKHTILSRVKNTHVKKSGSSHVLILTIISVLATISDKILEDVLTFKHNFLSPQVKHNYCHQTVNMWVTPRVAKQLKT